MGNEDWSIQLSLKTPGQDGLMVNLRAANWAEMDEHIEEVGVRISAVIGLAADMRAAGAATGTASPTRPPAAPVNGQETCRHGVMVYKEGVSKVSGKPWRGHFCPSDDRAEQCKPVFLR